LSLRIARRDAFTLDDLVSCGTVATELAPILRQLVARRLAFLVCGGTGTGKTTILGTLLGLVEPSARLVIVEDTAELRPDHPHVVTLEARRANIEGQGAVSMAELVRQALRMRPDRLVVGEARGAEIVDLLSALNTGHEGGCGTLHANSALDVPARVEALSLAAGWTREATHSQLAAAVHVVVHLGRRGDGTRVLREVAVPRRGADGLVTMEGAVVFDDDGATRLGPAAEGLERRLAA
jgi:pilus assembly protein CpaF